jgi:cell division ATPase FtsA
VSLADLAAITNARVEEIVAGIAHVLNETRYGDIISQIAITGGGSRLKNLTALMKYRLGREVAVAKPRGISAETCPKLFNVEYSTVVGLLVKGIEYMEKYNQRQIPEEVVTPEGGTPDGGNKPGPGGNVKPDPKPKPKPEKKSSRFMTWVNNTLKSMFGEDGTESKI